MRFCVSRIPRNTHRIYGTDIFTYSYHKEEANVGKYISPMDPMEQNVLCEVCIAFV